MATMTTTVGSAEQEWMVNKMTDLTLRKLIEWAMTGNYNLDKPLRFEILWTDWMKEYLPKDEVLYMPVVGMQSYDWAVILKMGENE